MTLRTLSTPRFDGELTKVGERTEAAKCLILVIELFNCQTSGQLTSENLSTPALL